jgi:serine phosphatase RsbU (regulator of sigma subunit)
LSLKLEHANRKFRLSRLSDFNDAPLFFRVLLLSIQLLFTLLTLIVSFSLLNVFFLQELLETQLFVYVASAILVAHFFYCSHLLLRAVRPFREAIQGSIQFLGLATISLLLFGQRFFPEFRLFDKKPDITTIVELGVALVLIVFLYYLVLRIVAVLADEIVRHDSDLQLANKIQRQLVPTVHELTEFSHSYGTTKAAYEVGGDFFTSYNLNSENHICAIGDVTGHDIAAGLLMAISKGAFHTLIQTHTDLSEIASAMNKTIYENSDRKMFLSFSFCRFNYVKSTMSCVNAGHLPLLHYRAIEKDILEINPSGIAFGLIRSTEFSTEEVHFNRGDVFVFLTDGLMEIDDHRGEEFSMERVKQVIQEFAEDYSPKEIFSELMLEANRFSGFKKIDDDVTFLAIKMN